MTDLPKTMNAFVLEGHGDFDKLVFHENWPVPIIDENEVLIKVLACGLNNTDVNTRLGWYSKNVTGATTGGDYEEVGEDDATWGGASITFPRIQGADVCGRIVAVGTNVDQSMLGKRIITDNWLRDWSDPLNMDKTGYYGSEMNGGYAEYTKIDHRNIGVIENDMSDEELATFSCSYTTAEGMLDRANVGADDVVLVTGASGGVGGALIQLSKRRGATVVALSSESKHAQVKEAGADYVLPRAPENLKATLEETISRKTVDVVADIVGGSYFYTLIETLSRGGRYASSGAIAGPIVEFDLRTFYLNDLTFYGSTVIPPKIFNNVVTYINNNEIKPIVAAAYPLKDFHTAQKTFIDKSHVGNIVVIP